LVSLVAQVPVVPENLFDSSTPRFSRAVRLLKSPLLKGLKYLDVNFTELDLATARASALAVLSVTRKGFKPEMWMRITDAAMAA